MRSRPRPRPTALERRQRYLDEMRRIECARGLTPRARRVAGSVEQRDPRFAELDALIAREDRKLRRAGIDPNAVVFGRPPREGEAAE